MTVVYESADKKFAIKFPYSMMFSGALSVVVMFAMMVYLYFARDVSKTAYELLNIGFWISLVVFICTAGVMAVVIYIGKLNRRSDSPNPTERAS